MSIPCADLTDVTLADEDTNSILTENANRAIQGNAQCAVCTVRCPRIQDFGGVFLESGLRPFIKVVRGQCDIVEFQTAFFLDPLPAY